jgi:hypothetical protein
MYFSYALGLAIMSVFTGIAWLVLPRLALHWYPLTGIVLFLPLVPAVFRYSRVAWMYFDRRFDPGP